jgi:serine O-acetyltransferase
LTGVVALLTDAHDALTRRRAEIIDGLRSVLFPGYFGPAELTDETMRFHVGATLDRVQRRLQEQIARGVAFGCAHDPGEGDSAKDCGDCEGRAAELTRRFLEQLPRVHGLLVTDVAASFAGDPAAMWSEECILCYPGVAAVTHYRLAHELYRLGVPLIPRMITEFAHSRTGVDIHPGATIGSHFFIDHGTGVVIGETSVIGDRVRLYQGVTLGAKSFPLDEAGRPIKGIARHPILGDDVIIYAGATILGRITVGAGAVIGGNVWVTRDVPPGGRVTQARATHDSFDRGAGI